MSAQFIVLFRGQPVRFTHRTAKRIWEVIPRNMASIFISEADAWLAVSQYEVKPFDFVTVEPLQQLEAAR
jgi:hypothetical protein